MLYLNFETIHSNRLVILAVIKKINPKKKGKCDIILSRLHCAMATAAAAAVQRWRRNKQS